jgi:hypothetical protein
LELLFHAPRPSPGRDRSYWIDALVFGAAGQTRARSSGRSSIGDPQSGDTQAETRSAGCGVAAEVTSGKPLSLDLDAFERTARSAHAAQAPSSMGAHEDARAESKVTHSCGFCGARQPYTPYAEIPSCSASTGASWHTRDLARRESLQLANSGSGCGSCCATRSITKSSVAAARCGRKTVVPVRGCQKWVIVLRCSDCETD